jgi:flagellum-specific peptidoglycan hydrolase FlgJ
VHRLESKFDAAREALAIEVDNYIQTVAPNAVVDALNLIDLCSNYGVDIRFVLAQGHVESHFATKGTARRTNSIFNVGAYDGHSANKQIKNGFGYKHPDYSVEPYLILLTTRYLIDGKTEQDLLDKFVDKDGKRYASSKTYETMLRERIEKMDSIANITSTYEVYCKYKLMLGR